MEKNQEVVKLTNKYLMSQGQNLDEIEGNIHQIYENSKQTNKELDNANKEQMKMLQGIQSYFQKTASGVWGIIKWPFSFIFSWKA